MELIDFNKSDSICCFVGYFALETVKVFTVLTEAAADDCPAFVLYTKDKPGMRLASFDKAEKYFPSLLKSKLFFASLNSKTSVSAGSLRSSFSLAINSFSVIRYII